MRRWQPRPPHHLTVDPLWQTTTGRWDTWEIRSLGPLGDMGSVFLRLRFASRSGVGHGGAVCGRRRAVPDCRRRRRARVRGRPRGRRFLGSVGTGGRPPVERPPPGQRSTSRPSASALIPQAMRLPSGLWRPSGNPRFRPERCHRAPGLAADHPPPSRCRRRSRPRHVGRAGRLGGIARSSGRCGRWGRRAVPHQRAAGARCRDRGRGERSDPQRCRGPVHRRRPVGRRGTFSRVMSCTGPPTGRPTFRPRCPPI